MQCLLVHFGHHRTLATGTSYLPGGCGFDNTAISAFPVILAPAQLITESCWKDGSMYGATANPAIVSDQCHKEGRSCFGCSLPLSRSADRRRVLRKPLERTPSSPNSGRAEKQLHSKTLALGRVAKIAFSIRLSDPPSHCPIPLYWKGLFATFHQAGVRPSRISK
jgi:hypothetical protein